MTPAQLSALMEVDTKINSQGDKNKSNTVNGWEA